jgi:hypothetical protein
VPAGESRTFAIAGVRFEIEAGPGCRAGLRVPGSYETFQVDGPANAVIRVESRTRLEAFPGPILIESNLPWRALEAPGGAVFEFRHPPTGFLYCQAVVRSDWSLSEVRFSETAWRGLASPPADDWEIPYPLDQLLLVPALALRGVVLLHACGAVVSNRGLVFAGHSGDGKTTLAGLLSKEGTALLSDERIAVRRSKEGFTAWGTPWPGEGNVVSNAAHPLAGMFVLRKAPRHALGSASPSLAADLLARAIVPYYLPDVASRILETFSRIATEVPFRELHFARSSGLTALLREANEDAFSAKA